MKKMTLKKRISQTTKDVCSDNVQCSLANYEKTELHRIKASYRVIQLYPNPWAACGPV